ncbi:MAG: methylated-DNA--[protein]-cysteine S-methyltransferase [Akkermansia sp.]
MHPCYALYPIKQAWIQLKYEQDVLIGLSFVHEPQDDCGRRTAFTEQVYQQIAEYLSGTRQSFDFAYRAQGTDFQQKVWAAIAAIPYGKTRSYKQIAEAIGQPRAYRAVGGAANKNPLLLIIPCHRVIGANKKLTGYAGGIAMKQNLLQLEQISE